MRNIINDSIEMNGYCEENVKTFITDERGDIVQTAVIMGILAILAFVVLTMLREPITNVFSKIRDNLQ